MLHCRESLATVCRVVVAPDVLEVHYEEPVERVWWHLHEEITRCHRCQTLEELLDVVFAWLQQRTRFTVEDSVYALPQAA